MMERVFMRNKSLTQIFLWPTLIAIVSFTGLLTALLVDDARELISDAAVALPILSAAYYYWIKPGASAQKS
ncbi:MULTISPECIES: hypothetical protein [unclassified Methylophilus]|uniref:hypothetical protein n=1 Tax=unclassified Methylophilus TaxID=2630143 RepID=UPI0006FB2F47|nr:MULTISPECIES: hypothetical protein [unclassified Methylophilus]KQT42317.1 hypothetical protein ASG34_06060 [Methylophilus sp. Leaf416]KQT56499.1 hypothetical protein ASG44_06035 [Methylophilus sp. Leaf459]